MGKQTAALLVGVGTGACRWIQRWRDLEASEMGASQHCSPNQAEGARSARPRIGGEAEDENCLDYSLGLRMLLNARILLCLFVCRLGALYQNNTSTSATTTLMQRDRSMPWHLPKA